MKLIAQAATVLSLTVLAAVGLSVPASAAERNVPHQDHLSSAHCMGWAISQGAVIGGPRAVAEHHAKVREDVGTGFGRLTASVASLPSCF